MYKEPPNNTFTNMEGERGCLTLIRDSGNHSILHILLPFVKLRAMTSFLVPVPIINLRRMWWWCINPFHSTKPDKKKDGVIS